MPKLSNFLQGLSESYLADLGRVVAAWSHVESQFQILYLSLVVMRGASSGNLNTQRVRDLMGLSLERQLREFRSRLDELKCAGPVRVKYERIFNQLDTLRNERDQVAHSMWQPVVTEDMQLSSNEGVALFKSWKNSKHYAEKSVKQERLIEIVERMEALFWQLGDLSLAKNQDFPPQPKS